MFYSILMDRSGIRPGRTSKSILAARHGRSSNLYPMFLAVVAPITVWFLTATGVLGQRPVEVGKQVLEFGCWPNWRWDSSPRPSQIAKLLGRGRRFGQETPLEWPFLKGRRPRPPNC
jgi:hypothetical protein